MSYLLIQKFNDNFKIYFLIVLLMGTSACTLNANLSKLNSSIAVSILGPDVNTSAQTGVTLTGTCQDGVPINIGGSGLFSPSTTTCVSGSFSQSVVFTDGDGTKNITISQTDAEGKKASANRDFLKDTTAPILAISDPAASALVQSGATLTGTCERGLLINLSGTGLSSPSTATCADGSFSQSVVFTAGDGTKNIIVTQTDAAGNSNSTNRDFIKDATAPVVTITAPTTNTSAQSGVDLTGSCENGLTVNLSGAGLSNPSTTTCTSGSFSESVVFTVGDGTKNIIVTQTDAAGNVSSANRDFLKDTTGPTLSITAPAANTLAQSGVALTGSCENGLTVNLSGAGLFSPSTTTCTSGSFSESVVFTVGDGTKNIIVTQTDAAGNATSTNRDFVKDTTAPILSITAPTANTSAQSGVTLTGACEDGLTVNFSGTGLSSPSTATCASGSYSQSIVFAAGDGTKNIIVTQTDAAGNVSSANRDFVRDTLAPSALLSGTPSNPSSSTSFNVTVGGTDVVKYKYKFGSSITMLCNLAGDYSVATDVGTSITDSLVMNFDYYMRLCVIGQDSAGNWQLGSDATTYDWIKDTNPPFAELSGLPASASSVVNLGVTVGGLGVVAYKFKVGLAAGTDCTSSADYSAESLIGSPISSSVSGLADGSLKLCVVGRDNVNGSVKLIV